MNSQNITSWFLAARPKTLITSLTPIAVGTALSYAFHGKIRLELSLFACLSSIFIQIGTNFINDAIDFKKGADTVERVGPVRATQSGRLSEGAVFYGGLFCFLIAMALAIPLIQAGGWPIVVIGLFSLVAGYVYTGGPYPLAYLGLGDLFVVIFFGWVAVSGIYYLNSGEMNWNAWIAGTQVGFLATVLIAINNFRDSLTDWKANKKTLPVRFGPEFARTEISFLCLCPFLMGLFWFHQGLIWAFLLPLLTFPIALKLAHRVRSTDPSPIYNQFLAQGALLQLSFGALLSLGFVLK
jgi:1,4-dihydroxy-2-naphthoate octaprenyltransferase